MRFRYHQKIGSRLTIGFGILIVLTIALGITAVVEMNDLADVTVQMYNHPLAVSNAVRDIKANIVSMHRSMKDVVLAKDSVQLETAQKQVNEYEQQVLDSFKIVLERFLGDKQDVEIAYNAFIDWKPIRQEVIELTQQDRISEASEITKNKGAKHVEYMNERIETMSDFASRKAEAFFGEAQDSRKRHIFWMTGFVILISGACIVVGIIITRSIVIPVNYMIKEIGKISEENLDCNMELGRDDEIGQLAQAFDTMCGNLKESTASMKERTAELVHANRVTQAINNVFQEALTCETEEELGKTCLAVAEKLTDSKFGILLELNPAGLLDTIAISNPGWNACDMAVSDARHLIKDMQIRGIDRSTVREGKSRIVHRDEMAAHPDKIGVPEGHPEITAFLSVPLKHEGKTIGMIGLGNKESGYDWANQEAVEALSFAIVEVLKYRRTELKLAKAREELVRTTRLAAIGQVSASIAHDVRNPLGAIRNAVYYLNRRNPNEEPEVLEYLGIIDEEVNTADRIITNLLQLARAKKPVTMEIDLGTLIESVRETGCAAASVQWQIRLHPDPFPVTADENQLRQVLINLGNNAIEAMKGEGEIIVEATRREEEVEILIRDTGPGVSEQVRKTLFEPLVTTKPSGTGLGLTISKQIIEAHGGEIACIANNQVGAGIRIRLPREKIDPGLLED